MKNVNYMSVIISSASFGGNPTPLCKHHTTLLLNTNNNCQMHGQTLISHKPNIADRMERCGKPKHVTTENTKIYGIGQ